MSLSQDARFAGAGFPLGLTLRDSPMNAFNVHERSLCVPPEQADALVDSLPSHDDALCESRFCDGSLPK